MASKGKIYVGRNDWGPKAWHLLHAFSIGQNKPITAKEKHCYYLFYKTFAEIIPCSVCKMHYIEHFYYDYEMKEGEISRDHLKHFIHEFHNEVNERLKKKKVSFTKAMKFHQKTRHHEIFYFMNHAIPQYLKRDISLEEFDRFVTFFVCFCQIYPDKILRKELSKRVNTPYFQRINTPEGFMKWYTPHFIK